MMILFIAIATSSVLSGFPNLSDCCDIISVRYAHMKVKKTIALRKKCMRICVRFLFAAMRAFTAEYTIIALRERMLARFDAMNSRYFAMSTLSESIANAMIEFEQIFACRIHHCDRRNTRRTLISISRFRYANNSTCCVNANASQDD